MTSLIAANTLEEALRLNAEFGYAPIPMEPETKAPLLSGLFENPPTTEDAIRDIWSRAQWRMNHRENPQWNGKLPNIAIHLGASGIILGDTDLPQEVESWATACAANSFDAGPPTVHSAGDTRPDGTVKHYGGQHWYFDRPTGLELPGKAMNIPLFPGMPYTPFLQTGARIAMRPPSIRKGKEYHHGGGSERRPLPQFLRDRIDAWIEAQKRMPRVGGVGDTSAAEVSWSEAAAILTLIPAGWEIVGDDRGCDVLRHPEASSDRSAVYHAAGCDHLGGDTDIPLLTIFSTGVGGWLAPLVKNGAPVTVTPLTLFARKHYGGDRNAARRALGMDGPRVYRRRSDERASANSAASGPGLGVLLAAGGYTDATAEVAVPAPTPITPDPVAPDPVAPASVATAAVARASVATRSVAPASVAGLTRTAPTWWDAPKLPSPLWEAAVATLRSHAVVPDELVEQRVRAMLTGTKWDREAPLREVHTTPPHLWVSTAAAAWGMFPDAVLPLLRLAAIHLEGELLILERVGADDADADVPGDAEHGIPGWLNPTIYRGDVAARTRALSAARPDLAAFYIFRITEGD